MPLARDERTLNCESHHKLPSAHPASSTTKAMPTRSASKSGSKSAKKVTVRPPTAETDEPSPATSVSTTSTENAQAKPVTRKQVKEFDGLALDWEDSEQIVECFLKGDSETAAYVCFMSRSAQRVGTMQRPMSVTQYLLPEESFATHLFCVRQHWPHLIFSPYSHQKLTTNMIQNSKTLSRATPF